MRRFRPGEYKDIKITDKGKGFVEVSGKNGSIIYTNTTIKSMNPTNEDLYKDYHKRNANK